MVSGQNEEECANSDTAICFLLINEIKELPHIAIASALATTNSDIYVGHINPNVRNSIPTNPRIKFVALSQEENQQHKIEVDYKDFGTSAFYELVFLKWALLRSVYSQGYKYIIYSDIDVVWLGDAASAIEKTFELFDKAHVLVQSFTRSPNDSLLCMGIFAFRKSSTAMSFINQCEAAHKIAVENQQQIGDDEIVTLAYRKLGFPEFLRELPQSTFAVGNFLDLYSAKPIFPGVHKPIPLVFHCNYVVGVRNKRLMMRLILNRKQRKQLQIRFGLGFHLLLVLKKLSASLIGRHLRMFFGKLISNFQA